MHVLMKGHLSCSYSTQLSIRVRLSTLTSYSIRHHQYMLTSVNVFFDAKGPGLESPRPPDVQADE
jgi:hypothetical protein